MIIIGIGHKSRQGKDAFAKMIVMEASKMNIYAKQYGFADALKAYARCLGMRKKDGVLLQQLGTNVFRRIDDEHWIRILFDTLDDEQPSLAVITDVRFKNEAYSIRRHNLANRVLDVQRFHTDAEKFGQRYVTEDRDPNHPSETDLDDFLFDKVIRNDVGLDGLRIHAKLVLADTIKR